MKNTKIPLAKSPEAWRHTAIGLKRGGDIIWEHWFKIFSRLDGKKIATATLQESGDLNLLIPTYCLLFGLSLENASKGILIIQNPSIVDQVVKWDIKKGGHDLCDIFEKAKLFLTANEKDLLLALTQAIIWAGRYPVPKNHANKPDFPIYLGPFFKNIKVNTVVNSFEHFKETFDKIYLRVIKKYSKK